MRYINRSSLSFMLIAAAVMLLLSGKSAWAHCDGLDGPVVLAAKEALKTGNVNLVLIWVKKDAEAEIKQVFDHTMKVRKLGTEAQELADYYFYETLVRIHRAGEGAPYTGLKPAGRDLGPAIPKADEVITTGNAKELWTLLSDAVHNGLHDRFMKVQATKKFDPNNVDAGREYVEAYVSFVHYVEAVYNLTAKAGAHEHAEPTSGAVEHQH